MPEEASRVSLREEAAFQLANVTKTAPQFGAITPRWLVRFLDWKPLEAGTFRVNKVNESKVIESLCAHEDESPLPTTFVDYQDAPREYRLGSINAVLNVHTRVSDLLSNPYDQVREQLRVLIESVKEKQESELLNNADYGLLNNVPDAQKIKTRKGAPTPDDLDELLVKVWKEPSLVPRPSARHCRLWARVHASRRSSADSHLVWHAVPHLARSSADSLRQDRHSQQGSDVEDPAGARGRKEAGRGRPLPARTAR